MPLTKSAENRKYIINKIRECSPDGWQLYELKPNPLSVQAGDWVQHLDGRQLRVIEVKEPALPSSPHNKDRNKTFKCDNRNTYSVVDGCCICDNDRIVKILSPSEVVVHIGCLSGTVKRWDSTTFHMFHGNSKFSKIHFDALDKETREIVESLLKAQEEKC